MQVFHSHVKCLWKWRSRLNADLQVFGASRLYCFENVSTHLQYPGCSKSAKYGPRDEPPIACQLHKRAGQFAFNHRGELLMATRNGDGKPVETLRGCRCLVLRYRF